MSFTQVTSTNLNTDITVKLAAGEAAAAAVANIVSMAVQTIQIADSSYNVLDDTAANTGGGYLVITGTGFTSDCIVIIGTTNATSTTYVNSTTIRAQVPAASAATYTVYVVDTVTGATAIKVNGLTYSAFPAWSTGSSLSNQNADTSFGVSLSASGDSSITYANTTSLPAGTTLAANGYFSGTVSIAEQTTYSFDVKATDSENQDSSRTFSMTVTVAMPNLYSWGWNSAYGSLGQNDTVNRSSPTVVGSDATWNLISSSGSSVVATKTDGTLWSWGMNYGGELGLNTRGNYVSSPTQVGTNTNWQNIAGGNQTNLFIDTSGQLWSAGRNSGGALGINAVPNSTYRSSPVQVGADTNWSLISSSLYACIATRTNGTLWTWGTGGSGQLGHQATTDKSSPTQVGALSTWGQGDAGEFCMFAVKPSGTLWAWGVNSKGQLGLNNVIDRSSPTQVGTTPSTWSFVASKSYVTLAIKTDGTLWSWGHNAFGSLGQNDRVYRSSPVQIGADTNWSLVATGSYAVMATKTDGTLWGWGRNEYGQVGGGNINHRSSPVQIGTETNWKQTPNSIATGQLSSFGIKV